MGKKELGGEERKKEEGRRKVMEGRWRGVVERGEGKEGERGEEESD